MRLVRIASETHMVSTITPFAGLCPPTTPIVEIETYRFTFWCLGSAMFGKAYLGLSFSLVVLSLGGEIRGSRSGGSRFNGIGGFNLK